MKQLITVFLISSLFACGTQNDPDVSESQETTKIEQTFVQGKGTLFIIGGGARPPHLVSDLTGRMVDPEGLIVILPMASAEPDTAAWYAEQMFIKAGKTNLRSMALSLSDTASSRLDTLKMAELIYICGGDQNRFMEISGHPAVRQQIHQAFQNGAIIAGTSAGAAVMSQIMITGDQELQAEYESTYRRLSAENAVYAEGLGLLETAIVDQHFIERSRYNRAITALHDHPGMTVFGIGESTALVLTENGIEIVGDGQVIRFDPASMNATADGRLSGKVCMEILTPQPPNDTLK